MLRNSPTIARTEEDSQLKLDVGAHKRALRVKDKKAKSIIAVQPRGALRSGVCLAFQTCSVGKPAELLIETHGVYDSHRTSCTVTS